MPKTTPKVLTKYLVGRMILKGKKVERVMRRLTTVGRFGLKKHVYEMASATWIKPPAGFVRVSILFATRHEARVAKWVREMDAAR